MDFARKQLEKYGWTDGKGLGKNENGISQALKPKLKRSVTGVGHDPASEFNEHWWTMLYDKAASNVEVKESDGKTKKINTKEDFTITNNTWQMMRNSKEERKKQYSGFFVRTAVMSGGSKTENVRDTESEEEMETKEVFKMTDEELFAACEGRTAHKGARHGLKALGKLARIAQQEELLLCQPKYNGYSHAKRRKENKDVTIEKVALVTEEVSKQKKKKNKSKQSNDNIKSCEFEQNELTEVESKGELEREDRIMQEEEQPLSQPKYNEYSHVKKKRGDEESVVEKVTFESEEVSKRKKKNKRKRCKSNEDQGCEFGQIGLAGEEPMGKLEREDGDVCGTVGKESVKGFSVFEDEARDSKKRRKRKNVEETVNIIEDVSDEKVKKKKKKLKNL